MVPYIRDVSRASRRALGAGAVSCALCVGNWCAIGWECTDVNTVWQFVLTEFDHTSAPLNKSVCLNQAIAFASTGPKYALQWTRLLVLQFCSDILHCTEQGCWSCSSVQISCTALNKADGAADLFIYSALQRSSQLCILHLCTFYPAFLLFWKVQTSDLKQNFPTSFSPGFHLLSSQRPG